MVHEEEGRLEGLQRMARTRMGPHTMLKERRLAVPHKCILSPPSNRIFQLTAGTEGKLEYSAALPDKIQDNQGGREGQAEPAEGGRTDEQFICR